MQCGRILDIRVIGYADDAALVERHVDSMATRLTNLGNASRDRADMSMNTMSKTFTHHVHRRDSKPAATKAAAMKIQSKYSHQCEFCPRKFKTARTAKIHQANCVHNYGMTTEYYELEKICDVFGHQEARWFLVKWKGYDTPEWEREHLLRKDGCHGIIRDFWTTSGLKPNQEFYPDPEGRHRCTICCKTYKRAQDLKAHRTREGHYDHKKHAVTKTAYKDAELQMRKEEQESLPKVKWGDLEAKNAWQTRYLGAIFEAGGGCMTDIRARIAMARQRFGKLRHIWINKELHLNLRLRLYKSCVCSVLTYGSEA